MPQLFPKWSNVLSRVGLLSLPLLFAGGAVTGAAFYRSDYTTGAREVIEQPVPFSHKHHVGELGIDCRYCHVGFDQSAVAGIPPTKTCMNCHQVMWTGSDMLSPVRESYNKGKPISWTKVHNVPDYTYFNHSIHVAKGVGCASCHGRVDKMQLMSQASPLTMEWCLSCHRAPEKFVRPRDQVFNMAYVAKNQEEDGPRLVKEYNIQKLTHCSTCHY